MNRLTEQLWIGDIQDARTRPLGELEIDHVITVCQDSVEANLGEGIGYDHFPISDGPAHGHVPGDDTYELFAEATDTLVDALTAGETVFVHCHAGQSRSVCACSAALATIDDATFSDALAEIEAVHGTAPSDHLLAHGARYVLGRLQ